MDPRLGTTALNVEITTKQNFYEYSQLRLIKSPVTEWFLYIEANTKFHRLIGTLLNRDKISGTKVS